MYVIPVQILRFVDDGFPGWVECELIDAAGNHHTIRDKVPIFTTEFSLDANSHYPMAGTVQCELLDLYHDSKGRELVRVTTGGVESTDGVSEFALDAALLMPSA